MVWNCSIVAVTLLFGVSGKSKAFRNESKTIGENDRAEYGKKLLEYLSEQLTAEFGKGFVLIDLKMGKLTHQDLGQMQMYVN